MNLFVAYPDSIFFLETNYKLFSNPDAKAPDPLGLLFIAKRQ